MSRKANPVMIGLFVVVALALLVVGVLLFTTGSLFSDTSRHVVFFQGAVRGLNIGSPVLFRGVRVGQVTDIALEVDGTTLQIDLPVVIEIEDDRFRTVGNIDPRWDEDDAVINALIRDQGLRAQLQMLSFVTGQLAVSLDFLPDKEAVFRKPEATLYARMHEIPSVPSDMEQVAQRAQEFVAELQEFPVAEIGEQVKDTLAAIESLAGSAELAGAIVAARNLMESPKIPGALDSIDRAATRMDVAMTRLAELSGDTDEALPPVLAEAGEAIRALQSVLAEAEVTLVETRSALANDSDVRVRMNLLMDEMTRTARSVRQLTEMLQARPEALVRGKQK